MIAIFIFVCALLLACIGPFILQEHVIAYAEIRLWIAGWKLKRARARVEKIKRTPVREQPSPPMACEKCWGDAYPRHLSNPAKSQSDHYHDLLAERKESPCTPQEKGTDRV